MRRCWNGWLLLVGGRARISASSVRVVSGSTSRISIARLAGLLLVMLLLALTVQLRLLTECTEWRIVGTSTGGLLLLLRLLSGRFLRLRSVEIVSTLSVNLVLSVLGLSSGFLRLLLLVLLLLVLLLVLMLLLLVLLLLLTVLVEGCSLLLEGDVRGNMLGMLGLLRLLRLLGRSILEE